MPYNGFEMAKFKGGLPSVLEMLELLDEPARAKLIKNITEKDPQLAAKLQEQLFTFESLADLRDQDLQALVREVQQDLLALALRNASERLKERLFKNMTMRAASMIKDTIAAQPPQKLSKVQDAQKAILDIARRLEGEGKMLLKKLPD